MELVLRQAEPSELNRLTNFYAEHASEALPPPSLAVLGSALTTGRVLIIEEERTGPILACAAIFDFSPEGWPTYVGELSGTRVTNQLGGFEPLNVQRILLAVRLLGHAAYESRVADGFSSTLVTVVKANNHRSIENVEDAGFVQIETKPGWMIYEEHTWLGSGSAEDWVYFYATDDTVRQAFGEMKRLDLFDGGIRLERLNRETGDVDYAMLRPQLADLEIAKDDLDDIHRGAPAGLSRPPTELRGPD